MTRTHSAKKRCMSKGTHDKNVVKLGSTKKKCLKCKVSSNRPCGNCPSTSKTVCVICAGTGRIPCGTCFDTAEMSCAICAGTAEIQCGTCHGTGTCKTPCNRCKDMEKAPCDTCTKAVPNQTICCICSVLIEGSIVYALGHHYHQDCFQCRHCKQGISNSSFHIYKGEPWCRRDYEKYCARKCHACNLPIRGRVVTALGFDWHREHFVCSLCNVVLHENTYVVRGRKTICSKCYRSSIAEHCMRCNTPITANMITAMTGYWHKECFQCYRCHQAIGNASFNIYENFPRCMRCSNTVFLDECQV